MTWLFFVAFYLRSDGLPMLGWVAFAAAVIWDWFKERRDAKAAKAAQEHMEVALGQIASILFKIELQQAGYKVSTTKTEMEVDGKKMPVTLNKVYAPFEMTQEVLDASREGPNYVKVPQPTTCGCHTSDLWHETGQHDVTCPRRGI